MYDPKTTVVLATTNKGKVYEYEKLLLPLGITVVGLKKFSNIPLVEETGSTFEENAMLKARAICEATNLTALADDSGLMVDALNGMPGIYSARYSSNIGHLTQDQANILKLLDALKGVEQNNRSASFYCCIAVHTPLKQELSVNGSWRGYITFEPTGSNGFGYDPIFFDPNKKKTSAEMSDQEKNSISHRAMATKALLLEWPNFWQNWLKNNS